MNPELAILVPVLGRPHRVQPLIDAFAATTQCDYRIVFLVSTNDRAEIRALQVVDDPKVIVRQVPPHKSGDYSIKINLGFNTVMADWYFTGADDLAPRKNWYEHARGFMVPKVGVIGTQDMGNRRVLAGHHSTHSLVARWYGELGTIDEPGKILHEGYPHAYCDDEMVNTAKYRGAWAFSPLSRVEHMHPDWAKGDVNWQDDVAYAKSKASMNAGRAVFLERRKLWNGA